MDLINRRVHRRMSVPNANRGVHPARRGSVRVLSGCGLERFGKCVFEESLSLFTTHAREPLEELLKRVPCLQVRYQTVHGNPRAGKHGRASHYLRIGMVYPPLIHCATIFQPARNLMSTDCRERYADEVSVPCAPSRGATTSTVHGCLQAKDSKLRGAGFRHHPGGHPANPDWLDGLANPHQGEPDAGRRHPG